MRVLFLAYRGNMRCGGQGIYLWFQARELARLGHEVEVTLNANDHGVLTIDGEKIAAVVTLERD